jgi:predicted ester cyclase
MRAHAHISQFGSTSCTCTEQEAEALAITTAYRAASVAERPQYLADDFVRHRAGFSHIGELFGMQGSAGFTDASMPDRQNIITHISAKDDIVFCIFRIVGTHTGTIYGVPPTDKTLDVIEVALWRVANGVIAEAWYFGDELGMLRQLEVAPPI